jgi:hypothetical protein
MALYLVDTHAFKPTEEYLVPPLDCVRERWRAEGVRVLLCPTCQYQVVS